MAAAVGTLKVSKEAYLQQIETLSGLLAQLDSKATEYQTAKSNLTSFVEAGDSQYDNLCKNIDSNIKAVRKGYDMCQGAIDMLKGTLAEFDQLNKNMGEMLDQGQQFVDKAIDAAIDLFT